MHEPPPPRRRQPSKPPLAEPKVDPAFRARLEAAKGESTLQLLFKAARLLDEQALERAAREFGRPRLRRSHTSLLPHVALTGTRITDLAGQLGITKQAVSQLVDELEALGVMARVPDPEDARARRVVFTREGQRGLLEGLALLRTMEQELSRAVGSETMDQLRRALLAILGTLPSAGEQAAPCTPPAAPATARSRAASALTPGASESFKGARPLPARPRRIAKRNRRS